MGQKKPEDDEPQFQFADDEFAEQTWFNKAKDAGVRYVRTFSEKSGLKVLPQMTLEEEEDPSVYKPGQHKNEPRPAAQQGAPVIQQRSQAQMQMPSMQTNAARLATARQKADALSREKGQTVMRTLLKLALFAAIAGFVGQRLYKTVNNAKVTGALRSLDEKKKGDKTKGKGKAAPSQSVPEQE